MLKKIIITYCVLSLSMSCKHRSHNEAQTEGVLQKNYGGHHHFGIEFAAVTDSAAKDFWNAARKRPPADVTKPEIAQKIIVNYFEKTSSWFKLNCVEFSRSTKTFTRPRPGQFSNRDNLPADVKHATLRELVKKGNKEAAAPWCNMVDEKHEKPLPLEAWTSPNLRVIPYFGDTGGDGWSPFRKRSQEVGIFKTFLPVGLRYNKQIYRTFTDGHLGTWASWIVVAGNYIFPMRTYAISKGYAVPVGRFDEKGNITAVYDFNKLYLKGMAENVTLTRLVTVDEGNIWQKSDFTKFIGTLGNHASRLNQYVASDELTPADMPGYDRIPVGSLHFMVDSVWFDGLTWPEMRDQNGGSLYKKLILIKANKQKLLDLYEQDALWMNTYDTEIDTKVPTKQLVELEKDVPNIELSANIPNNFFVSVELILGNKAGRDFAFQAKDRRVVDFVTNER